MDDRTVINRMLMSAGLGRLEDGAGLMAQLGYLVEDHEHFRQMLATCEPGLRHAMYESLRPYLRFDPKPLDVYISETARLAEAKQLPIQDPDGRLRAFNIPEIRSKEAVTEAQVVVNDAFAKFRLVVICRKCTREEVFTGDRKADAVLNARLAGWTYDEMNGDGREICPRCPAVREAA